MTETVHRPLKIIAFNANDIGRYVYELRRKLQELKIDVALFSETDLIPHIRYIRNYHTYRTDRQGGHKGGTAVAAKKGIPKYAHVTIQRVLQEVFTMWSASCLVLVTGK
jgi:hypothetical protein